MNSRLDRIKDWPTLAKVARFSSSVIARTCGVSPRQLERFFQARMHKSPHQWLRTFRMQLAIELITAGASVKHTALELCYKDSAHFCRDFKDYFGVTPSQWLLRPHLTKNSPQSLFLLKSHFDN